MKMKLDILDAGGGLGLGVGNVFWRFFVCRRLLCQVYRLCSRALNAAVSVPRHERVLFRVSVGVRGP